MDINDLRSLSTLLLFLGFTGMMVLVMLRGKGAYDEAANLPFDESNDYE